VLRLENQECFRPESRPESREAKVQSLESRESKVQSLESQVSRFDFRLLTPDSLFATLPRFDFRLLTRDSTMRARPVLLALQWRQSLSLWWEDAGRGLPLPMSEGSLPAFR
jgi:hypothetical protein